MDSALFNMFDLPMVLAIFIGLVLACTLVIFRPRGHQSVLLAAYLYSLVMVELDKLIFWSMPIHRLFESAIPVIFVLGKGVGVCVAPLLYLYIGVVSTGKPVSHSESSWLFIPALGMFLSVCLYFSLGGNPDQYWPSNYHNIFFDPVFLLMLCCKYGAFLLLAAFCLRRKTEVPVQPYKSSMFNINTLSEQRVILIGALCLYCFEFATDFLALLQNDGRLLGSLGVFHNYMMLLYLCMVFGCQIKNNFLSPFVKPRKSPERLQRIINDEVEKINKLMLEQKYYLNSDLTLELLAKKLKMPEYQLSSLLNKQFDKNFYDFINYYRTEHAKSIMSSKASEGSSILDILYESGFSSKSAFNRYFKKYTGVTPSEYREKIKVII